MLDIIILILLLMGTLLGLKRGFILQFIRLTSFILSIVFASLFYKNVAPHLKWIPAPDFSAGQPAFSFFSGNLEAAYYNAIAFVVLFIIAKILLRIIGSFLSIVAGIPVIKQINQMLGAVLGFLEVYLFTFVLLYVASVLPIDGLQQMMGQSSLANVMINHTPYLSGLLQELWTQYGG
ncbi:CvpA family protein [Bacillus halotolerans]|uniref:CvpA family protein n=1 Tax=Bacillus halotolerans TaxID=260554 RepID=UPI0038197008